MPISPQQLAPPGAAAESPQSQGLSSPGTGAGMTALAIVYLQMGMAALVKALGLVGPGSEIGRKLVTAISSLSKIAAAGGKSDLMPAEMASLLAGGQQAQPPPGQSPGMAPPPPGIPPMPGGAG